MSIRLSEDSLVELGSAFQTILVNAQVPEMRSLDLPPALLEHPRVQRILPIISALRQVRSLETSIYRFVNNFAAISRLPPEVMHEIFQVVLDVASFAHLTWKARERYPFHLRALRLVSSRWNDLLTSSPIYWTCIHILNNDYSIAPHISRSGLLPLHVSHDPRHADLIATQELALVAERVVTLIYHRYPRSESDISDATFGIADLFPEDRIEEEYPGMAVKQLQPESFCNLTALSVNILGVPFNWLEALLRNALLECLHIVTHDPEGEGGIVTWLDSSLLSLKHIILEDLFSDEYEDILGRLNAPQCIRISIWNRETEDVTSEDYLWWAEYVRSIVGLKKASIVLCLQETLLRLHLQWPDGQLDYDIALPPHGYLSSILTPLVDQLGNVAVRRVNITLNSFDIGSFTTWRFQELIPRGTEELYVHDVDSPHMPRFLRCLQSRHSLPGLRRLVFEGHGFQFGDNLVYTLTARALPTISESESESGIDPDCTISFVHFNIAALPVGGEEMSQRLRELGIQVMWTDMGSGLSTLA